MLVDFTIASYLNATGCVASTRRHGSIVVATANSETPLPGDCLLFDASQIPTQAITSSLVSSDMRGMFRASIRQDLARVIADIGTMQDPDVSDEYRALAEAVCASSPGEQTPEQLQAWATELSVGLTSD